MSGVERSHIRVAPHAGSRRRHRELRGPSHALLDQLPGDPVLVPVRASAQDIAERHVALPAQRLDAIVIKEAVHHVPASDRHAMLNGLAELLAPAGRIVIGMLPAQISYPLFPAALQRFESLQPDPADIAAVLSGTAVAPRPFVRHA